MQVLFVTGLEGTLREYDAKAHHIPPAHDAATAAPLADVRLSLADDTTLITTARRLHQRWPTLCAALESAGHRLVSHKCAFWAPRLSQGTSTPATAALATLIPQKFGGLTLLGSTAQGMYTTDVDPELAAQCAMERATAAAAVAKRAVDLAYAQHDTKSHAKAWSILRASVAHALVLRRAPHPAEHARHCRQWPD